MSFVVASTQEAQELAARYLDQLAERYVLSTQHQAVERHRAHANYIGGVVCYESAIAALALSNAMYCNDSERTHGNAAERLNSVYAGYLLRALHNNNMASNHEAYLEIRGVYSETVWRNISRVVSSTIRRPDGVYVSGRVLQEIDVLAGFVSGEYQLQPSPQLPYLRH